MSRRESFQWSFTGFNSQDEAERAVADMVNWFNRTYNASEWNIISSVSNTPNGFRGSLNCEKSSGVVVEDVQAAE